MGTSSTAFEGTLASYPAAPSSGYATFTVESTPNGNATDWSITDAQAKGGTRSAVVSGSASVDKAWFYVTTVAATTYFRGYYYISAAPAAEVVLACIAEGTFAILPYVSITTARRLSISDGNTVVDSSTNVIPLNAWFRVEGKFTATSVEAKLWTTSIESTGTPDVTLGPTSRSSIGSLAFAAMGANNFTATPFMGSGKFLYMDDLALSDAAWLGPTGAAASSKRGPGIGRY